MRVVINRLSFVQAVFYFLPQTRRAKQRLYSAPL